ncbi:S1 family peptidase [Xanthomonas melonis]|uniref:S1 family peptidase n=1 Tax=Xanthomonas melonis TaxID=56456 RepID=UPI003EB9D56F
MKKIINFACISIAFISFHSTAQVRYLTSESDEAKAYSKSAMISTAEAARRVNIQENSKRDLAALARSYNGRLAGAYWEESPEFQFVIRLKGNEQPPSAKVSTPFGDVPVVIMTGASKTSEEVKKIISSNQDALFEGVPGLQGTSYDEKTGQIVLYVNAPDSEKASLKAEIPALEKMLGNPVRIQFLPGPLRQTAYLRGGNILQGSNGNQCTSGFMVWDTATKTAGVLTAGHCPDSMIYYNWVPAGQAGQIVAVLDFKKEMFDAGHDLQWHGYPSIGYTPSSSITGSTTSPAGIRAIQFSGTASVGERLCHRGVNTGFSCGVVSATSFGFPPKACNGQDCDSSAYMTLVGDELACFGGDSGGPVWSGATAYGIVKSAAFSGANPGQCGLLVYMRIGKILDAGLRLY